MKSQKLYAGAKLRETRTRTALTQKAFAARLGISLSYLNQMENNHRPLSALVVLALAREFAVDVRELAGGETARLAADLREALADPLFDDAPPAADLQLVAANAPRLARAFLALHRKHRETAERLASLGDREPDARPWEQVRDFFHYCDNYIDAVDRAAEHFAHTSGLAGPEPEATARAALQERFDITVRLEETLPLRAFDAQSRTLTLSRHAPPATRAFLMLHQGALLGMRDLLEATLDLEHFHSDEARDIARLGLANYFAGAALMPYGAFHMAARESRHDLERLSRAFGTSIEQTAHRLSTLQRPGAKGVPFFFVRVDQAGNITKRHSATALQFARFGGACPLWNVHAAFETPSRFLRQLAETPDGRRYFCLARDVSKPGGSYSAPVRRFAIGLGCETIHAGEIVYADGLDTGSPASYQPIGISCRICPRDDCHQRSVPPIDHPLSIDPDRRGILPYSLKGADG